MLFIANPDLVLATLSLAEDSSDVEQKLLKTAQLKVGMNSEVKVRFDFHAGERFFSLHGYDLNWPASAAAFEDVPGIHEDLERKGQRAPKIVARGQTSHVGWYWADNGEGKNLAEELGITTFPSFTFSELIELCLTQKRTRPARRDDAEGWNAKDWLNLRNFGNPTALIVNTDHERLQMSFIPWLGGLYVLEHNLQTGVVRTYIVQLFETITVGRPLTLTPLTVTDKGEFVTETPRETAPVRKIERFHMEFDLSSMISAEEGVTYTVFDRKTWRAAATARSYSRSELLRACRITLQLGGVGEDRLAGILVTKGLLARVRFLIERFFEGSKIEAPEVSDLVSALENMVGPPEMHRKFPKPFWFVVRFLELLREELQVKKAELEKLAHEMNDLDKITTCPRCGRHWHSGQCLPFNKAH